MLNNPEQKCKPLWNVFVLICTEVIIEMIILVSLFYISTNSFQNKNNKQRCNENIIDLSRISKLVILDKPPDSFCFHFGHFMGSCKSYVIHPREKEVDKNIHFVEMRLFCRNKFLPPYLSIVSS